VVRVVTERLDAQVDLVRDGDRGCAGYAQVRCAGSDLVIAETTTRYLAPARLADEVTAQAIPIERGRRSIRVRFDLTKGDGEVLVTAETTYVCVGPTGSMPLPAVLANALTGVTAR
jgi:acyl-CoA thioesterase FadM